LSASFAINDDFFARRKVATANAMIAPSVKK